MNLDVDALEELMEVSNQNLLFMTNVDSNTDLIFYRKKKDNTIKMVELKSRCNQNINF